LAKLVNYDNTGVEESSGGTGVKVKPGVKIARIAKCTLRDQNKAGDPANDLELALDVGEEYDWVFSYIGLSDAAKWKMAEFTRALGLKESGKFDPDKMVGKFLRVKINPDTYDGAYSPRAGRFMKAQPGDEEAFEEGANSVSEMSNNGDGGPEAEPEDAAEPEAGIGKDADGDPVYENPDFVASREGEEDVGSYDDWADEDLVAECEDRGLTLPGGRGSKRNKAIKALRDEDAEVSGASEGDEEPEAGDDYDDWELDALKAEWESREMGDLPSIRGRNAETRLKKSIVEALREDDETNPFDE
jgi:hypothetical protein